MRATASFVITLAILTVASPPDAGADEAAKIAVVITDREFVSNDVGSRVAEAVEEALRAQGLEVVPWSEGESKVPNLDARCQQDAGCVRATGDALGVSDLMLMSLAMQGDKVVVELTWADAATGSAIPRPRITIAHINEIRGRLDALEGGLVPQPAAPAEPSPAATAGDGSLELRFWITAGIGGASLLTAGALGLYTRTRHQRCKSDRDAGQPCAESELDSIDRAAVIGDVFLVTSVAALTTATVFYFLDEEPSESPAVGIAPSRGGAQISVTGRF